MGSAMASLGHDSEPEHLLRALDGFHKLRLNLLE